MLRLTLAVTGLLLAGTATAQMAKMPMPPVPDASAPAPRPAEDVSRDVARHPADMVAFAGIKPGAKVADFIPGHGYFTRIFAAAVKPGGSVVAILPQVVADHDKAAVEALTGIATDAGYGDVSVVSAVTDPAVADLDVFWTAQNYHDLHNLPEGSVAGVNKAIFRALKPGGVYVVIDHAAAAGSGVTATKTLHRIDPAVVKAEVIAAGFVLDGETMVLANPADPHTANVFDPAIRGHTDQFGFRFRKPG